MPRQTSISRLALFSSWGDDNIVEAAPEGFGPSERARTRSHGL